MDYGYIGVTGFMNQRDVYSVLNAMPMGTKKKLMVGILASSKTLAGQPNKYPNRYPTMDKIGSIAVQDPRVLNLVHVATGGEQDPPALTEMLLKAHAVVGPHCNGVQVNAEWPAVDALVTYRTWHPYARVVLQLGPGIVAGSHEALTYGLGRYIRAGAITDVLIDGSGGRGTALDAARVWGITCWLLDESVQTGFAGGLCAASFVGPDRDRDVVNMLLDRWTLSIDAEGRLRDADDHLDVQKARAYVDAAGRVFDAGMPPLGQRGF
jgi:hypothetical protein